MPASVTSLDQDMKRLRLERYTPSAANEIKTWIQDTLGESLPPGDPLEALKDGVALCKLANLVLPAPGIKFKASAMPFTQMENISQFLRACELPPLNLPAHDRFLTVDLYDNKDPAQVIQCIGAFSRAAHAANPARFPKVIGPKRGASSPTRKTVDERPLPGSTTPYGHDRGLNATSQAGNVTVGATSPEPAPVSSPASASKAASSPGVSSWSKKTDEGYTAPAWNIHQYGYMGGASQGNQGISFGARRQITSQPVSVPSVAEKEQRRKQQEAEEQALREKQLAEERQRQAEVAKKRQAEAEEEERQARIAEQERWEDETRKAREKERQEMEATARQREAEREREREHKRQEEERTRKEQVAAQENAEKDRIKELERQLEEAKQRERQYQLEREERAANPLTSRHVDDNYQEPAQDPANDNQWAEDERQYLQKQHAAAQDGATRPLPSPRTTPSVRSTYSPFTRPGKVGTTSTAESTTSSEPPTSSVYSSATPQQASRTDRFLATNRAPSPSKPQTHFPSEMGLTSESERAAEDARREQSQAKTKAGGWASKSLLEREMERERQRQREWEEAQIAKQQQAGGGRVMGPRPMGGR